MRCGGGVFGVFDGYLLSRDIYMCIYKIFTPHRYPSTLCNKTPDSRPVSGVPIPATCRTAARCLSHRVSLLLPSFSPPPPLLPLLLSSPLPPNHHEAPNRLYGRDALYTHDQLRLRARVVLCTAADLKNLRPRRPQQQRAAQPLHAGLHLQLAGLPGGPRRVSLYLCVVFCVLFRS